jgi:hypothetical protein
VINQFNEKYPKTTISYVTLRKLVKKFVEIGSSLNVKKIRKYLDENDEASVLVFIKLKKIPKCHLKIEVYKVELSLLLFIFLLGFQTMIRHGFIKVSQYF